MIQTKVIPQNSISGYKIYPANFNFEQSVIKETIFDSKFNINWKDASYPQNCIKSALRYLPNYYDRGFEEASLHCIITKNPLNIIINKDEVMKYVDLDVETKEKYLFDQLFIHCNIGNEESYPLMKNVGEKLNTILNVVKFAIKFL